MADLPELPDGTKRKLELQWNILLDKHGFTGQHFSWHADELHRRRRIAALPGERPGCGSLDLRSVDSKGIEPSERIAKARFNDLAEEFWPHWLSSGTGYEEFRGLLNALRQRVSGEVAAIWTGKSRALDGWYKRACRPAVDTVLGVQVKEWSARAREKELKRLSSQKKPQELRAAGVRMTKPRDLLERSSPDVDTNEGTAERANVRSAWLNQKLVQHETWTSDLDIAAGGGLAYNTIQRYRSGAFSTRDLYVRRQLANAFKCKITEVPK